MDIEKLKEQVTRAHKISNDILGPLDLRLMSKEITATEYVVGLLLAYESMRICISEAADEPAALRAGLDMLQMTTREGLNKALANNVDIQNLLTLVKSSKTGVPS